MEVKVLEVWKVSDLGWDWSREITIVGEEGNDFMGFFIAFDTIPVAAVGFWVPRGVGIRVFEGFLYLEKDFFVFLVAELREKG